MRNLLSIDYDYEEDDTAQDPVALNTDTFAQLPVGLG
jgi:hypothetical protein